MQTADFDHNDFNSGQQNKQDEALLVKFFVKQVKNQALSSKEGRPIFRDVEYVDIKIPGNRTGGACRPATHKDKQRFPRHYDAFIQRTEAPIEGTPLIEWPLITRSQAEELAFYHVKTVEQLIGMSDSQASKFMGMRSLIAKAKEWLELSQDSAKANQIQELEEDNAELKEQLKVMLGRLDEMQEKLTKREARRAKA